MMWLSLNIPLAVVFVVAWAGIPLWMVMTHPDEDPAPAGGVTVPAAGSEPVIVDTFCRASAVGGGSYR